MDSVKRNIQIPQPLVGLSPVPVVLVSCIDLKSNRPNIITIGWVGVVCSKPPMVSISVRPSRYSYKLIKDTKDFVINIPTVDLLKEVDYCGTVSGKSGNKFEATGLIPLIAKKTSSPLVKQCPVNLECSLQKNIHLGSHNIFIGEVVSVHVDSNILDNGRIDYERIKPLVVNGFEYWSLGEKTGDVFVSYKSIRNQQKKHELY